MQTGSGHCGPPREISTSDCSRRAWISCPSHACGLGQRPPLSLSAQRNTFSPRPTAALRARLQVASERTAPARESVGHPAAAAWARRGQRRSPALRAKPETHSSRRPAAASACDLEHRGVPQQPLPPWRSSSGASWRPRVLQTATGCATQEICSLSASSRQPTSWPAVRRCQAPAACISRAAVRLSVPPWVAPSGFALMAR